MPDKPEEIERKLAETHAEIERLKNQYEKIRAEKIEEHEECCADICTELIGLIKKQESNLKRLKGAVESSPKPIHTKLHRAILLEEERIKELNEFKSILYARAICECK